MNENSGMQTYVPVVPVNGGFGGMGMDGNGWWILLLFILMGGWNSGGAWGGGGMDNLYPWMNNSQNINGGFRDQMLNNQIEGLRGSVDTGFSSLSQQMYTSQMADMERSFAAQTANTAGLNAVQAQLSQCCCDNRAATADLKYTMATEACATRQTTADALRDVLNAQTAGTQRILDQMCQDKIDAKNEEIAQLRAQLQMAQLSASQNAQTATIQAGQRALANEVEQYVLPTPRPAYIVQNPNCCPQNVGCGCAA